MYKINEIFETIQGEGFFTGTAVVFIRLQGCPVECAWCDTKQTWSIDIENKSNFKTIQAKSQDCPTWADIEIQDLIIHIQHHYSAKHIVITGGEPCTYDLLPLTSALEQNGYFCQIETSGTFEISTSENTWVTVSPKINMRGKLAVLKQALQRANEIKHPVARLADLDNLDSLLFINQIDISDKVMCLQPVSQKAEATKLCIETCIKRNWRLSVQLHKYLNIA